ncbi:DUF6455 family protein [uncultured Tateyamaria sp.]|uniref:DUF6455 family protein n=1 Tax=uncultured Tateyamaria sp. TaxID=455651 RepID=UPI002615DF65|nr:DUF6455 family protein [uncultured Tateyamaria sp.]
MGLADRMAPSADLMTGMMDRLGKTVVGADEAPTPARARMIRNMVFRCTACPEPAACAALQRTVLHLDAPPLFCPNTEALKGLPDA